MELLSAEYGWTPEEVRNQRLEDVRMYLEILQVKREIQKAEQKKTQSKFKRKK